MKLRSSLGLIVLVAICAIGIWTVFYIRSGPADAIAISGPHLLNLRQEWIRDGSPQPPSLQKYITGWTDAERYMIATNEFEFHGQRFKSLFAMEDPRFEGQGRLIVTREGELVWMDTKSGPRIIKPNR